MAIGNAMGGMNYYDDGTSVASQTISYAQVGLNQQPLEQWLPQWARQKHGAVITVSNRKERKEYLIRGETGTMSFVEMTAPYDWYEGMAFPVIEGTFSNWIIVNGLQDRVARAEKELLEHTKKKRIRMGKWGIKKEFIRGQ